MSRGLDYSKWDHFGDSSDEDEHSKTESSTVWPRVTRLDAPSKITTNPDGSIVVASSDSERNDGMQESSAILKSVRESTQPPTTTRSSNDTCIDDWTDRGGQVETESGNTLYWSQDRHALIFRLTLESNDRNITTAPTAKKIQVTTNGFVPYRDRHHAVGAESSIEILYDSDTTLLSGTLPHPCHYTEDDDEEQIDWIIESHPSVGRHLIVTLLKATPMPDMVIWWRRPLAQYPETPCFSKSTTSDAFSKAWSEAHQQFKEKIRSGALPRMNN